MTIICSSSDPRYGETLCTGIVYDVTTKYPFEDKQMLQVCEGHLPDLQRRGELFNFSVVVGEVAVSIGEAGKTTRETA